jgi:UDP-2,3-diacylglucosamine pyrophosphatase LpxH
MHTIVISDIHLGSRHCRAGLFLRFLDSLPAGADLVMNGDVVDHWHRGLKGDDLRALERIREESRRRKVVWVRGNHDDHYEVEDPAGIEVASSYRIGNRLYVSHGFHFDSVMPYHKTFIAMFHLFHQARIRLGAEPVHVAYYAKKFSILYNVLRRHVCMNAIEYAKENGFAAVACGHTHFVEDRVIDGIRYLNTGSWTEVPVCYVDVTDDDLKLVVFNEA